MRTVLITGGTGGIGFELCKSFTNKKYKVITSCLDHQKNKNKIEELNSMKIEVFTLDISSFENCKKVIKEIIEKYKKIDVLVNNAGITRDSTLLKMTVDKWQEVIDVNLSGIFNMCKCIVPYMREERSGRIINISSVNGLKGQFGQCNYAASKSGMYGFTRSLAFELARRNITVNCISPGYINTEMTVKIPTDVKDKIIETIPLGRMGEPRDVARAALFLAAEEADYITGSNFSVNGGLY